MDRIDIHIEVVPVPFNDLINKKPAETSDAIRERVISARTLQEQRFENLDRVYCNAQMSSKVLRKVCHIDEDGNALLKQAIEKLNLSARAYTRILKVARTIADLEQSENIQTQHLAEAIHYRSLDRENWGS